MTNHYSWGARWILPIDQPPIENGLLTVVDGRIESIKPGKRNQATEDLGEAALMPLFVNAHTHLEFSSLPKPLGQPGMVITDWIREVIKWRSEQTPAEKNQAIAMGLKESLVCGSTGIGEIATTPWFNELALSEDILVRCFVERLGTNPDTSISQITEAKNWLQDVDPESFWMPGLSPHAPYSICDELFRDCMAWAEEDDLPVAMHLAESRAELEFIETGKGPFRQLFESLGIPAPTQNRKTLIDYLQTLSRAKHALIVHGNYLSTPEFDFIAECSNLSVVFCPRTHAYFKHDPYPLIQMLDRNIDVAVGTDSRASNPDLNVLYELQEIRRQFPNIPATKILEMGTLAGARALQLDSEIGTLSPGRRGEFLTIPLEPTSEPEEAILNFEF